MRIKTLLLPALLCIGTTNLFAQTDTKSGSATIVHASEISAASRMGEGLPLADSVLRVASIAGKYNVGISVVTRSKINGKTPPDAIVHDVVSEVYHIMEGKGILIIGGTLDSAARLAPDGPIVRKITGPTLRGKSITGGRQYEVGPGDMVIIPPNTPHGFLELKTRKIVYTLVRVDSEKVLELKN